MAQLYANENFPREVVIALRRLGHDVLTVQEAGNGGRGVPDDEVLAFAIQRGRRPPRRRRLRQRHRFSEAIGYQDADVEGVGSRREG